MALGQHNARAQTLLQWWLQRTGWCGKSKATIMKNKILLFAALAAVSISLLTPAARAQSATNAPPAQTEQTFFTSAQNYLTTFNPAFTWTNVTLEAATGYKQVTGVGATSVVDLQYDLGRWNVGSAFQFSGVGSPVNAVEAQAGYALFEYLDAKVDLDLRAGYDWNVHAGEVEPGLFVAKKMTPNTFAKLGVSLPIYFKGAVSHTPTFYLETGFTF